MSATLDLTLDLMQRPSVTPFDADCQTIIAKRLAAMGFANEHLRFDDVDNLWARRGHAGPLFCFAGHTDVVPSGNLAAWSSNPFSPEIRHNTLYGRGAADMKSAIAAMVIACERFIHSYPQHKGSIAFLLTSDEEGPSINGTVKVIETLEARKEKIDWCLVGEPSSSKVLGDVIKNGRRGSLNGKLTVTGKQGHVAYPELANNPIHLALQALTTLSAETWDAGNAYFPPTTFQFSNVTAGTGVTNVIPETLEALFNFRFSTEVTPAELQRRTCAIFDRYNLPYHIDWTLSGSPFITPEAELVSATKKSILQVMNINAQLSTTGGTSDGRFIAPTGAQVIELGVLNASIHQIDEHVALDSLDQLCDIYFHILVNLLT